MRKNLKPSLRQDSLRRVRRTIDPVEEIIFDVGQDTTINFEGSPLMQSGLVNDPNGKVVVNTDTDNDSVPNTSYKDEDWIAIGLAVDNVTGATDDIVDNPGPNQGDPEEGSGGDFQPPTDVAGTPTFMEYTQIGPKRSILLFDLTSIPPNAEITEATLSITNTNMVSSSDDVFNDGSLTIEWPGNVTCEVLSLPEDTTADCTWNTKDRSVVTEEGFDVPDPTKRWWRTSEPGVVPPNAIGIAQNTRREDRPEPQETFDSRATISTPSNVSGVGGEYYGHIGYGISGGGYAVNIDPANPSAGHPTFDITVESLGSPNTVFSVDVSDNVQYSITNQNRRCNLLLRAQHWDTNDAADVANVNEQRRYPENLNPDPPLEFERAYITSPLATSGELPDTDSDGVSDEPIENDQTLHAVTVNLANADSVTYEWQIQIPVVYENISNVNATINNSAPREQDVLEIASVLYDGGDRSIGGDGSTDVISYQWFRDGVAEAGETNVTYIVPEPSAGNDISCVITVSNLTEGDVGADTTVGPFNVLPDGDFTLTLSKNPNSGSADEETGVTVSCSTTGVNRPFFKYTWYILNTSSYPDFDREVTTDATSDTNTLPDVDGPDPVNRAVCDITLYEGDPAAGGVELITGGAPSDAVIGGYNDGTDTRSQVRWNVIFVGDPEPPDPDPFTNGIYDVFHASVSTNVDSSNGTVFTREEDGCDILGRWDDPVLSGCNFNVLEEPVSFLNDSGNPLDTGPAASYIGGQPFGKRRNVNEDWVSIYLDTDRLNRFHETNGEGCYDDGCGNNDVGGLITFLSRGDDTLAPRTPSASDVCDECTTLFAGTETHMVTLNGVNGKGGNKPGDVAVWIDDFSDTGGWIIMEPTEGSIWRSKTGQLQRISNRVPDFWSDSQDRCSNKMIGWSVKNGTPNRDEARSFLRGLTPFDTMDRSAFWAADSSTMCISDSSGLVINSENTRPSGSSDANAGRAITARLVFYNEEIESEHYAAVINATKSNPAFMSSTSLPSVPAYSAGPNSSSGGGGGPQPKPGAETIPTIGDFGENADGVISFTSTSTVTDIPVSNYNEGYPESDLDILTVGNVTLADKNTTTDFAFARFYNQYVCPRVEPVNNVLDPADPSTVLVTAGNTKEYYDYYYGGNSTTYDPTGPDAFGGPNFALVTYQWDEVNGVWNLVGYRTGNKIQIPEFTGNLPDHMYFRPGEADATDYLDESMGHVLYVFDTRTDYETNVPAQWRDITSWNTTTGVSFPIIPI